jgi:hypothetical protein
MLGDGSLISLENQSVALNINMYPEEPHKEFVDQDLIVYPNPVRETLHIRTNDHSIQKVELYDAMGRMVINQELDLANSFSKISTNSAVPGFYILRVQNQNGIWLSRKIQIVE